MYLLYSLCSLRGLAILPDLFSDRPPHHPSAQGGKRSWPNPEVDYRPLTEVHTLEEDPWVRFLWFGSSIEFKRARRLSRRPSEETEWAVWTLIDWTGELSISDRAWSFLLWSLNTSLIWVQLEWLLFYSCTINYPHGVPMATNCVRRVTLTGVTRLPRRTFVPTCRQFAKSQSLRYASDTGAASAGGAAAPAATTTTAAAETAKEAPKKSGRGLRRTVLGTSLALTLLVGWVYGSDTRASIHRYGAVQLIRTLFPDAEDAHHIGVDALRMLYKYGLHPRERGDPDGDGALETEVFGYKLSNPIGISGGLDKHGEIPDPLFAVGPAIVEVGGTTPLPQDGNPRPRVFRLPSQKAMINRYGLNSKGADHMAAILEQRVRDYAYNNGFGLHDTAEQRVLNGEAQVPPGSLQAGKLLAVQVAKNKATPDADIEAVKRDYVYCVDRLAKYADILVVNVSSPNTPGLRDLQATAPLTAILKAVVGAAKSVDRKTKPYVMVKVSPDEDSDEQVSGICDAVRGSGVDGVIVGNTTNRRPDPLPQGYTLPSKEQATLKETGGYSGPQLFDRTVVLVARYRAMLDAIQDDSEKAGIAKELAATTTRAEPDSENVPSVEAPSGLQRKVIFASGGITNGKQARAALDAGASVAMMYTGVVYGGVGTVTRVKQELREETR